jgi:hypothetical protein
MLKNSTPTSQKTHCVLIREVNRLIDFNEIVPFYYENNMKHFDRAPLCWQDAETRLSVATF